MLIGLQADWILSDVSHSSVAASRIVLVCSLTLVAVIVLRLVWVFAARYALIRPGADPVFEWISGTGARPVLAALGPEARAEFSAVFKARLREAYPPRDYGTVLPFRRIFAVATK